MPVHGKSIAYTFEDPYAPSAKDAQYFEMWGHRAIWMDGWKAVTRHFRGAPFEADNWALFNLEEDFSEIHNLAEQEPKRLQRMIDRWWIEAGRYNVLPLDDRMIGMGGPSDRPGGPHDGLHYRYYPPTAHVHNRVAPVFPVGDWEITAEVERSNVDEQGVLFATGSMAGGFSIYVQHNRLWIDYNSRESHTIGQSESSLPLGRSTLTATLSSQTGGRGVVTLSVDGQEAGQVEIPNLGGIAVRGGADIGADRLLPGVSELRSAIRVQREAARGRRENHTKGRTATGSDAGGRERSELSAPRNRFVVAAENSLSGLLRHFNLRVEITWMRAA